VDQPDENKVKKLEELKIKLRNLKGGMENKLSEGEGG
jgi:hypothetical protein